MTITVAELRRLIEPLTDEVEVIISYVHEVGGETSHISIPTSIGLRLINCEYKLVLFSEYP